MKLTPWTVTTSPPRTPVFSKQTGQASAKNSVSTNPAPAKNPVLTNPPQDTLSLTFGSASPSPRQRRIQLYLDFMEAPVPLGKRPLEFREREDSRYERWGESYKQEPETPEELKQRLAGRPVISLPKGYRPSYQARPTRKPPYKLPTATSLGSWFSQLPGRSKARFSFAIPPVSEQNIQVRPPKVSPYMEMTEGSVARAMVDAGLQPSEIAEAYQANWSAEKTSRDILQNFFDSHGQTLEGVGFEVEQAATGEKPAYRVKITGRGQYDFEKAYVLGASDKQDDDDTAGGYGEGLKIIALNLLRDYGAQYVKVSSANWAMTYTLPEGQKDNGQTPKLYNQLDHLADPSEQPKGNYFEFVTDNLAFLETLFKATNYFYHPYNPDFQQATYENDEGGFKLLPEGKQGNVYVALQRYEYAAKGNWDHWVPRLHLWKRSKMAKTSTDRDRTHLGDDEMNNIMQAITKKMTAEEIVDILKNLEGHWPEKALRTRSTQLMEMLCNVLSNKHKAKMVFSPQYVASNLWNISSRLKISAADAQKELEKAGYILCRSELGNIGMTLASDVLKALAPEAFHPEGEKQASPFDTKLEIKTVTDHLEALQTAHALTPGERVRLQVLQACFSALSGRLSRGAFYPFKSAGVFLWKHPSHSLDYFSQFSKEGYESIFQISKDMLQGGSLEQALFKTMALALTDQTHPHHSAEYTYKMTDFAIELTQLFFKDSSLREHYQDLHAVWELSKKPGLDPQQLRAARTS